MTEKLPGDPNMPPGVEERDCDPPTPACRYCGEPVPMTHDGEYPDYCSRDCMDAAYT